MEEFGAQAVLVRAVPPGFETDGVGDLLKGAMARLLEVSATKPRAQMELRERLASTLACKRAVKAGMSLTWEQQLDLLRGRSRAFQPQNCPHGRPAELFISWRELERRFDRK